MGGRGVYLLAKGSRGAGHSSIEEAPLKADTQTIDILLLGSGGREHALAAKLAASPRAGKLYIAPGNGGTASCGENVVLDDCDPAAVAAFAQSHGCGLVVIGPEAPLVAGVADAVRAAGIPCFGPGAEGAQMEGSKLFSKQLMERAGIPTAAYGSFTDEASALAYVREQGAPLVVKADGLAAGKGVVVAMSEQEAHDAIDMMLEGHTFGNAGARVVIEDFLDGEEASFIVMVDGENILPMATSQDHKRLLDADQGPNTGGMGAYSPAPVVTPDIHAQVMREIIRPTVQGMAADGIRYTGFLYAGLMISHGADGKPIVRTLEFNCRFGDPETQPIMMRVKSDFSEIIEAGIDGKLDSVEVEWDRRTALGVVCAARGYPAHPEKGAVIEELPENTAEQMVFHAGTALNEEGLTVVSGGRVLCVVGLGESIAAAQKSAYAAARQVKFDGMQMRSDIGYRALNR